MSNNLFINNLNAIAITANNLSIVNGAFTGLTCATLNVTGSGITTTSLSLTTNTGVKGANTQYFMVPSLVASGTVSASGTTQSTIFSFSVPTSDTSYIFESQLEVSAFTSGALLVGITFTGASTNVLYTNQSGIGISYNVSATAQQLASTGQLSYYPYTIYAKASTTIIATVYNTFNATYTARACLRQATI